MQLSERSYDYRLGEQGVQAALHPGRALVTGSQGG